MEIEVQLIFMLIYIFPVITLFRNYKILRSPLYLQFILIIILTFLSFNFLGFTDSASDRTYLIPRMMINFLFTVIMMMLFDLLWKSTETSVSYNKYFWCSLSLLSFISFQMLLVLGHNGEISDRLFAARYLIQEAFRFLIAIGAYSSFKHIHLYKTNRRTIIIKNLFRSIVLILGFMGITRFSIYFVIVTKLDIGLNRTSLINWFDLVLVLGAFLVGLIIFLISIFFPEALIISKTQILLIRKLYDIDEISTPSKFIDIGQQHGAFISYLHEISDEKINDT